MPNHVHVIIVLRDWDVVMERVWAIEQSAAGLDATAIAAQHGKSSTRQPILGQVVAYYKYQTTIQINRLRHRAGVRFWQRGFYDHIVRNQRELTAIRQYIVDNPLEWALDRDNPINMLP